MSANPYFFSFFLLLAPFLLSAQLSYTVESVPNPKDSGAGYISDPDNYLTESEEESLNRLLASLEDSSTAQVAIVIVTSIGSENPKDFATRLFNYWGIGQADTDNGLLIFSVVDQRRTEFETGYGLEAVLPDVYCYRIGMQELVPFFKEGNYGLGLIAAVRKIREILEDPVALEEIRSTYSQQSPRRWLGIHPVLFIYGLLVLTFLLILAVWLIYGFRSKVDLYDRYQHFRKAMSIGFIFLFPLPYLAIYFFLRNLTEKLRNSPRYSKVNGKPMHKLNEQEDNRFLEKGQITEEEIGSLDYDVWVTDEEDDVLILRYRGKTSKYSPCPKCQYKTYYLAHTQVIQPATRSHQGRKRQTYECKNCRYEQKKIIIIPKISDSGSSSGSSGGGGGSWGGGSSGGGGAGVSW